MKKKILLVSTSFPGLYAESRHLGGAAFLLTEAKALTSQGYEVRVIMPSVKGTLDFEAAQGIEIDRVSYPLMSRNPGYNSKPQHGRLSVVEKISQIIMALFLMFRVAKTINKDRYLLLWSNWLQVGFLSAIGNCGRLPHLLSVRGSDVRESPVWLVKFMTKFTPNLLNMYPDDPEIQEWIKKYSFKEVKVPGVYVDKSIERKQQSSTVLTIIGRLDNERSSLMLKGLGDELFVVIEAVLKERNDFSVVVVGGGKRLEYYKQQMSGFKKRVFFRGWMTNFDAELSQASFVIGGSGLNGVIMDSVPNEVPVLISKKLTGTLWRDQENCLVYDPCDLTKWKEVIHFALDHSKQLSGYATKAKTDLNQFALPYKAAGPEWVLTLETFCSSHN